jgi:hypothetical protein
MSRTRHQPDRVVLKLTGTEATHGLPLANFSAFVESFRNALRDFDRQRTGSRTRRSGHPTTREDLVTAFRLVSFKPGSAICELEAIAPPADDDAQEHIEGAELLPLETLRAFVDSIEQEEPVDDAVTTALGKARRSLGDDGRIDITIGRGRRRRRAVIDARRVDALEKRAKHFPASYTRITGHLHMIDLEPDRVGIRAADGVEWSCSYPPELEKTVKGLVGDTVAVAGFGQKVTSNRGTLTLETIDMAGGYEQTDLFTLERIPLYSLVERQASVRPGLVSVLPDDLTEDEADDFLAALLDD